MATEFVDDAEVVVFLKIHLLLYADDTVILAEIPNDLFQEVKLETKVHVILKK